MDSGKQAWAQILQE